MTDLDDLMFTATHEWVRIDGDIATVGITDHAQEELGDVALFQLPEVGRILQQEEKFGEIESIKAISDLYAPVAGEVVEINSGLTDAPQHVNEDPYAKGWIIKLKISEPDQVGSLLRREAYEAIVDEA